MQLGDSVAVGHTVDLTGGREQLELRVLVDHAVIGAYDSVSAMSGWYWAADPSTATAVQLYAANLSSTVDVTLDAYRMGSAL